MIDKFLYLLSVSIPFIAILIFGLTLMLHYKAAKKMYALAKAKGYDADKLHIFDWCFWYPLFGYLYTAGLPDLRQRSQNAEMIKNMKEQGINLNINGADVSNPKSEKGKTSYSENDVELLQKQLTEATVTMSKLRQTMIQNQRQKSQNNQSK